LGVDRETIEKRFFRLEHSLRKLKKLSKTSWEVYIENEGIRDQVERNLQIAAQICIDIGNHIIAYRGYRVPYSYGDIFAVLREENLLPETLANTMIQIAGFRNILVHDYLEIDHRIVFASLKRLDDFKQFAEYILTRL